MSHTSPSESSAETLPAGDLLYRESPGAPFRPVKLAGGRMRIGRRFENDLILSHGSVSRFHAELLQENDHWVVVDCASKFGTFLNGERITRSALNPGDEIRVGRDDGPILIFNPTDAPIGDDSLPGTPETDAGSRSSIPLFAGSPASSPDVAMDLVERFRATSLIGDYHEALVVVADAALELTHFDRVILFLSGQSGTGSGALHAELVRGREHQPPTAHVGREVEFVRAVMAAGRRVSVAPVGESPSDFPEVEAKAREAGIERAVCVPLRVLSSALHTSTGGAEWATVGALYLEGKSTSPPVTERAFTVIESLADEAGLVADRLYARQSHIARIKARWDAEAARNERRIRTTTSLLEQATLTCALAEYLSSTGDLDKAAAVLEPFEDASMRARLPETVRAEVLEAIGHVLMWQGNWHRATGTLNAALDAAVEARSLQIEMRLRPVLARVNAEIGEFGIAREHALTALSFLRRSNESSATYGRALVALGIVESRDGDLPSATHSFRQAVKILDHTEDLIGRSSAHYWMGSVLADRGDTADAIASFQHMLEIAHPLGNPLYQLLGLSALARCLVRSGAWQRAETVIATGLGVTAHPIAEREHGRLLLLSARIAIWRDSGGARAAVGKVREYATQTRNQTIQAEYGLLEAELETGRQDLTAARAALGEAADLAESLHLSDLLARTHLGLAEVERCSGDYVAADRQILFAQRKIEERTDLELTGALHHVVGKLNADRRRFTEAQHSLAQSLSIFRTIDDRRQIALVHLDLGQLMLAAGDPACARTHLQQARESFADLGLASALALADAGLTHAMASVGASSPASYSSILLGGTTSEPRFVRRLLEATQSRGLLLRELTSIAIDIARANSAVVLSCTSDGEIEVATSSGVDDPVLPPILLALRAAMGESVHDGEFTVYPIETLKGEGAGSQGTVLIVHAQITAGSRTDRALSLVVQLTRQGLDLLSLRSSLKRAELPDPRQVGAYDEAADANAVVSGGLIYTSPGMRLLTERLQRIRTSTATVLVTGESGVGKELIARAIHTASPRARAPFVPFNCSAAPREMIESQLFGHKRGAFTGAMADYPGMARAARGGTLFLDEVGDLPLDMQPKLLRFLELGEIQPLGETTPQHVDVRVVAATNAELERAVAEKRFREDLYHRLNIIRIHVPPLRERREDIPLLVSHFLGLHASRLGHKRQPAISEEVLQRLTAYSWPGNVRQLRNEIERLVTFSFDGATITRDMLSEELQDFAPLPVRVAPSATGRPYDAPSLSLPERLRLFEMEYITQALYETGSNLTHAALALGMARQNLQRRLKKLGLKAIDGGNEEYREN